MVGLVAAFVVVAATGHCVVTGVHATVLGDVAACRRVGVARGPVAAGHDTLVVGLVAADDVAGVVVDEVAADVAADRRPGVVVDDVAAGLVAAALGDVAAGNHAAVVGLVAADDVGIVLGHSAAVAGRHAAALRDVAAGLHGVVLRDVAARDHSAVLDLRQSPPAITPPSSASWCRRRR